MDKDEASVLVCGTATTVESLITIHDHKPPKQHCNAAHCTGGSIHYYNYMPSLTFRRNLMACIVVNNMTNFWLEYCNFTRMSYLLPLKSLKPLMQTVIRVSKLFSRSTLKYMKNHKNRNFSAAKHMKCLRLRIIAHLRSCSIRHTRCNSMATLVTHSGILVTFMTRFISSCNIYLALKCMFWFKPPSAFNSVLDCQMTNCGEKFAYNISQTVIAY